MPHLCIAYVHRPDHMLTSIDYLHDQASVSLRVRSRDRDVDYAHCSAPHVAALALQALKTPLFCTLASGYATLYILCGLAVQLCSLFNSICSCSSSASTGGTAHSSTDLSLNAVNLTPLSPRGKLNSIGGQETRNIPKRYQHS